jgi:hypothetical protein
VADILCQRGVRGGSVLLLADGALPFAKPAATAHFQLASGVLSDAAALLGARDVVAVVMMLECPRAHDLEPILAALAPLIAPGVLLVVTVPASPAKRADNSAERRVGHRQHGVARNEQRARNRQGHVTQIVQHPLFHIEARKIRRSRSQDSRQSSSFFPV